MRRALSNRPNTVQCYPLAARPSYSAYSPQFIVTASLTADPRTYKAVHSPALPLSWNDHNLASPALLNRSSLFMYTVRLLTALCLVLFISSLTGTPLSLLDVT